ncbi:hypothetical protein [Actinomadura rugatobispora]|uniref:Uncharacterized protein n=1 Tax=Actinomadura rugatobispora TaxID=1994 RepID=A0ABW1AB87_9ACTN
MEQHPDTWGLDEQLWRWFVKRAERDGRPVQVYHQSWRMFSMSSGAMRIGGAGAYGGLAGERGLHRLEWDHFRRVTPMVEVHVDVLPVAASYDGIRIQEEDVQEWAKALGDHGGPPLSPVRTVGLRHVPTGILATCTGQETTQRNRMGAWTLLRSQLLHLQRTAADGQDAPPPVKHHDRPLGVW